MKGRTERTIITGKFAGRTSTVKLDSTDPTDFVIGHIPTPGGDGVPLFDGDFHSVGLVEV